MLIFAVVAVIFYLLVKFTADKDETITKYDRKEEVELVFKLPREIVANDRPELMPIFEREIRRRKLLNEVFNIGLHARRALEEKQKEDLILSRTGYYYPVKKSNLCLPIRNQKTK